MPLFLHCIKTSNSQFACKRHSSNHVYTRCWKNLRCMRPITIVSLRYFAFCWMLIKHLIASTVVNCFVQVDRGFAFVNCALFCSVSHWSLASSAICVINPDFFRTYLNRCPSMGCIVAVWYAWHRYVSAGALAYCWCYWLCVSGPQPVCRALVVTDVID